ncbi:MAG: hypothetical protein RQ741_14480 [Wenzhouxiangellaceae bacterium]|nr:hypothetical protein [Wenzhouxiangellaceae bacterium]
MIGFWQRRMPAVAMVMLVFMTYFENPASLSERIKSGSSRSIPAPTTAGYIDGFGTRFIQAFLLDLEGGEKEAVFGFQHLVRRCQHCVPICIVAGAQVCSEYVPAAEKVWKASEMTAIDPVHRPIAISMMK